MDRNTLYNNLDPFLQSLYDGRHESCDHLVEISKKRLFSKEQHVKFIEIVGDLVLGMFKVSDLSKAFSKTLDISDEQSDVLVDELKVFLLPLIGDPSGSIQPLHTMETDVDKVHGYGTFRELYPDVASDSEPIHHSSQDDTLGKPKLAEMPKYSEGESEAS